ncbi:MAG: DUF2807 domain-containing protein [Nevskia sp.]|nr:DUF2807 domain-containing protein [Nevskia sp.]
MSRTPVVSLAALAALSFLPALAGEIPALPGFDDGPAVSGSGHVVTQTRQPGSFDAVQSNGSFELRVSVGGPLSVVVEADDNLQDLIRTRVESGTLVVDSTRNLDSRHMPRIRISTPSLSALTLSGSGNAKLSGVSGDNLAVRISGSGNVEGSGKVRELALTVNGDGGAELAELEADTAKVRLEGGGDSSVNVAQTLDAVINGSADLKYHGSPKILSRVHGTGAVEKD